MSLDNNLGVFLNTGILANYSQDLSQLIEYQESLMQQFLEVNFVPSECVKILKELLKQVPDLKDFFDIESISKGGCIASEKLLYDLHQDRSSWLLMVDSFMKKVKSSEIEAVADALRQSLQKNDWHDLAKILDCPDLLKHEQNQNSQELSWPKFDGPRVQRLEHASVLIASETTNILIDPISLAIGGNVRLPRLNLAPSNLDCDIDSILISHSHLDHWHIPSILRYGGDGSVPVIVPNIPRASLLTQDDLKQSLKDVGQCVLDPHWGETVKIGDIEIDILPFYGEQPPVKVEELPEDIWNWGNCYRVTTPQFSVILTVDSGMDSTGSVDEVIQQSVDQRGEPDLILSCCREIKKSPFFQGLFTFWMVLPMATLQELAKRHDEGNDSSITLGPQGIGEVCVKSGAKAFSPYANGFSGVGVEINDIGWINGEPSELDALVQVENTIMALNGQTDVIHWTPGDALYIDDDKRWHLAES